MCFDTSSALTLLAGQQERHPDCKKWWDAGVVICLERGTDLHMAQLTPLPLTVSCFSKIQIGFTFLVPTHPGSTGKTAVKQVCVCVCVGMCGSSYQQLCRAKLIDDNRLSPRDVNAHVTMNAATFQTNQNSEVDRQPLRICRRHTHRLLLSYFNTTNYYYYNHLTVSFPGQPG